MGGYGSGQYQTLTRKTTVEECLPLDINQLARAGFFKEDCYGSIVWSNRTTGEVILEMQYNTVKNNPSIIKVGQRGIALWATNKGSRVDKPGKHFLPVITKRPYFGGERFYFTCPLGDCGKRVSKLYLPPNESRFACRHCHNLGYKSQRLSKKHRMIIQDSINQYLARRGLPLSTANI